MRTIILRPEMLDEKSLVRPGTVWMAMFEARMRWMREHKIDHDVFLNNYNMILQQTGLFMNIGTLKLPEQCRTETGIGCISNSNRLPWNFSVTTHLVTVHGNHIVLSSTVNFMVMRSGSHSLRFLREAEIPDVLWGRVRKLFNRQLRKTSRK